MRVTPLEYRLSKEPLEGDLGKLGQSIGVVKVDETEWEPLWDDMAGKLHNLG
jgi:hypothetical protein